MKYHCNQRVIGGTCPTTAATNNNNIHHDYDYLVACKQSNNDNDVNSIDASLQSSSSSSQSSSLSMISAMTKLGYSQEIQNSLIQSLLDKDLLYVPDNVQPLIWLSQDFISRPEQISTLLQSDFDISPLQAHLIRATIMEIFRNQQQQQQQQYGDSKNNNDNIIIPPKIIDTIISSPTAQDELMTQKTMNNLNANSICQSTSQKVQQVESSNNLQIYDNQDITSVKNSHHIDKTKNEIEGNNDKKHHNIQNKTIPWKAVIVNKKSKQVRAKQSATTTTTSNDNDNNNNNNNNKMVSHEYGLPANYATVFPLLAEELDDFYKFMTTPNPFSQDDPIRPATAKVYLTHAKLFLGWYINENNHNLNNNNDKNNNNNNNNQLSFKDIIPTRTKESATPLFDFINYLRTTRNISVSYEANMLRGLTKFIKFRFSKESTSDPAYGDKSYDDIPLVRELRKLHRDANRRQSKEPRSSNEQLKWLSWPEYLNVVSCAKDELLQMMQNCNIELPTTSTSSANTTTTDSNTVSNNKNDNNNKSPNNNNNNYKQLKEIAIQYQRYLILALFANVPDRQRTIRELEIGRTFLRNDELNTWGIKHSPDDYKTGKSLGDRPLLQLPPEMTFSLDDFILNWRPHLLYLLQDHQYHHFLFVQPKTGNPLTQNSVYQIVSRTCYKHSGKKTNPHLLRDMIVTHVRESSNASEKELEALALFMGHSIEMQRSSYDRRTLAKKVAPAVDLLQSINK